MIFRKKDPDAASFFTGMHFSDGLVIALAAILSAVAIYLLLTPEDFGAKFAKAAKVITTPAAQQSEQPATPGVAPAMIFKDDKKK
ncbi:MAG: hypothetical protein ACXWLJ_11850 [Rhizomicrobium sp.]